MRTLIMLSGRKRTGKGSIFEIAKETFNNTGEFFFAKPLKDFCIGALGITHEQMYGNAEQRESPTRYKWGSVAKAIREKWKKSPEEFLTAREVLQVIGTDIMREQFDPQVWAEAGVRAAVNSTFQCCVFTDLRMKNELEAGFNVAEQSSGFLPPLVVRLYRDTGLEDSHITEKDLDDYDAIPNQRRIDAGVPKGFTPINKSLYVNTDSRSKFHYLLDNNGTLEDLKTNTHIMLDHWLKGLVTNESSNLPELSSARRA